MSEHRCFRAEDGEGWHLDVVLFDQQLTGEIRAYQHDVLKWTHTIGLNEIALFAAKRTDLIGPYLDGLMQQYRPH